MSDITASAPPTKPVQQVSKRPICQKCNFPPRTCICPSLPPQPLSSLFKKCRLVVLQHPHELRRKNRSLPLVELCLFGKGQTKEASVPRKKQPGDREDMQVSDEDFVMKTVVRRRFGDHCDSAVMNILRDPNEVVVLVFPHEQSMLLEDGIRLAEERCGFTASSGHTKYEGSENEKIDCSNAKHPKEKKMTLIFIDATWKQAREMEVATAAAGEWPKNLIRVQIIPSSGDGEANGSVAGTGNSCSDGGHQRKGGKDEGQTFIERRFQIRTPPSPDHLSTAECLAWIASRVEENPQIYQSIMKTMDYMVQLWKGFTKAADGQKKSGNTGWDSMSQKKRKISHV